MISEFVNKFKRERLVKKINKETKSNFSKKTWLHGSTAEGLNATRGVVYLENSFIGKGTYIGSNSRFTNSKIGRYCSIGSNVKVVECTHPTELVSTYPAFYNNASFLPINFNKNIFNTHLMADEKYYVVIGNDVWIGNDVLIKGGITIGDGAVIAMGSIVVKNIPPYAIVGGNPAKIIRFRFDEKIIDKLLNISWWSWNYETIRKETDIFLDINRFVERFGK